MACSLIISFLIAWLAIPIIATHSLRQKDIARKEPGAITQKTHQLYGRLMAVILLRPWLIVFFVAPLLAGGYLAYKNVGSGFLPHMDEGGFILDYKTPAGTSLDETDRLLRQVEAILKSIPDVATYSRRTGTQLGGGLTEPNTGDYFIRLKPFPRRPIEKVMDDARQQIEHSVPGLQIETAQLMEDLIGDLTAVPQPIEIKLYSDDENTLKEAALKVEQAIKKVRGVVEVKSGIVLAGDALEIDVDPVKAALEGVSPESVATMAQQFLQGTVTSRILKTPKLIGVRVWIPEPARRTVLDVGKLLLTAPDGHLFPLERVAKLTEVTGQPEIDRDDLRRMAAVTGRISGRDLGSTVQEIKTRILDHPGFLPKEVPYRLGGLYEQQQIAFHALTVVLVAAVVLVFALLLFLYESFRVAFAMLAIPLLAVAGVFIGLWATRTEFNITSRMGMTMIVGIVTEVAIFYFSEYNDLPASADRRDRYIEAGKNRMRAIAMTTFAAVLALLPLALGIGQGSAMQQPLAIAIIAGLVFQLPLALIILPAILMMFKK